MIIFWVTLLVVSTPMGRKEVYGSKCKALGATLFGHFGTSNTVPSHTCCYIRILVGRDTPHWFWRSKPHAWGLNHPTMVMIIHPKFRAEQLTSLAKSHQSWGMLGVLKHLKSSKHPETSGVHLAKSLHFRCFFKEKAGCQADVNEPVEHPPPSRQTDRPSGSGSGCPEGTGLPKLGYLPKTGI